MSIQIKAKMECTQVKKSPGFNEEDAGYEEIQLYAVYSADPTDENFIYSQATPCANAYLMITNPKALGAFKQGKEYVITFAEVEN